MFILSIFMLFILVFDIGDLPKAYLMILYESPYFQVMLNSYKKNQE